MTVLIRGRSAHLTLCLCSFTLSHGWIPASPLSANLRHTNSVLFSLIGLSGWQQGLSKQSGSKLQGNSTNTTNTPGTLTSLGHIFVRTLVTTQWDAPISVNWTVGIQQGWNGLWRLLKAAYWFIDLFTHLYSFTPYTCLLILSIYLLYPIFLNLL